MHNTLAKLAGSVLLAVLLGSARLQGAPPMRGTSPHGTLAYELVPEGNGYGVWLFPRSEPGMRSRLCYTAGSSAMRIWFLPHDGWVLVQDGDTTLGVDVRVFRRVQALSFHEDFAAGIAAKAERLAMEQAGFPGLQPALDHRYAIVRSTPVTPRAVSIAYSGYGRLGRRVVDIKNWHGLYDLVTGRMRSTSVVRTWAPWGSPYYGSYPSSRRDPYRSAPLLRKAPSSPSRRL